MFQKTFTVTSYDDVNNLVDLIRQDEWRRKSDGERAASAILLSVAVVNMDCSAVEEMLQPFRDSQPMLRIVAATDHRNQDLRRSGEKSMRLSFMAFRDTSLRVLECDLQRRVEEEDPVRKLLMEIDAGPAAPAAIMLYAAGAGTNISQTVRRITEAYPSVPVFGGLFSESKNLGIGESYVYHSRKITNGYVVAVLYGDRLHVDMHYLSGWKPLGREFVPEVRPKLDPTGLGDSVVKRIDGRPAVKIYEKYLKVKPDDAFISNTAEFPLAIQRDGMTVYRVPFRYDHAGQLYFSADIRPEDRVRFAYATPKDMIRESERKSQQMAAFHPDGIYLFGSLSRISFLGKYASSEIEYFQMLNENAEFHSGLAQIYAFQGKAVVGNGCLVAVGIREGDGTGRETEPERDYGMASTKNEVLPLKDRLATFMAALANDLIEAVEDAEQANAAKSRFLSNMSHEIRTPINTIMGMDEMILRESGDETALRYAGDIQSASNSLLGIVNDILDFSKIEAGKLDIIPVEYSSRQVLTDLILMVQKRAEDKKLALALETDPEIPKILYGDEIRIKQVVTNLLTNAVKYTEKGTVSLRVQFKKRSEEEIDLRVVVKDTGIGIKQEDMGKLFNAFERIEEKRNRTIEGTGLGMNITLRLLELMGSKLSVQSTYGEGSEFSFVLRQRVCSWEPIGALRVGDMGEKGSAQKVLACAPEAELLIVDDTVMNLTVMKSLLRQNLVKIDTATSGAEAVEMVRKKHYDLLLLDFRMPGMDGIETLRAMRALPDSMCPDTPAVCLTANAISGAREQYLAAGFVDMLTKPVVPYQLEEFLLRYLPKEKLLSPEEAAKAAEKMAAPAEENAEEEPALSALREIEGLSVESGIQNCGGKADYLQVVKIFTEATEENSANIRSLYEAADWKNFTIKVHALKSSARILGANQVSELAAAMEQAGNDEDLDYIRGHYDELMALYELLAVDLHGAIQEEKADDSEKPEIPEDQLQDALMTIQEFAYGYDLSSVEMVLEQLRNYRIPAGYEGTVAKLQEAAKGPDWEALQGGGAG